MKQRIFNHLKNSFGWKTKRKIVVFSVDDYGNIRLGSAASRSNMNANGLRVLNRFDAHDTLETTQDLEMLYEALTSVKDVHGKPAVFTAFSLPVNIDYESMAQSNYESYIYELLPNTYKKLSGSDQQSYQGAWALWQEGIDQRLLYPQFHGREHLNLKVFKEKLEKRDQEALCALRNRSYTSISETGYSSIRYTAAFEFWDPIENAAFDAIIIDGIDKFKEVFGFAPLHFNPPGGREHPSIHKVLFDQGIKYLDTPFLKREHQGFGTYKKKLNYTGKSNNLGMIYQVRNAIFEPTHDRGFDWVKFTLRQIDTAFKWNKPAIISSHRVNFCGYVDQNNRKIGITALKSLLKAIVLKWPDVEFMTSVELGQLIEESRQDV